MGVADLLFFSGDAGDDHHAHSIFLGAGCATYFNRSLSAFFLRSPKGFAGGVDWQLYPCLQKTVRAFAAESGLHLVVMHKCAWVVSHELTWLTHVARKTSKLLEMPHNYKGESLSLVVAKHGPLVESFMPATSAPP